MAPPLVIVGGAPGSGKTMLATLLARELRLPLLSKDAFKERLADVLGAPDREASRRVGSVAYVALYATAGALIGAGAGVVVESNFYSGLAEPHLLHLLAKTRACQIHCQAPEAICLARYEARARHSAHFDALNAATWRERGAVAHPPLALAVPLLAVDTTDGYTPPFERILAFLTEVMAEA